MSFCLNVILCKSLFHVVKMSFIVRVKNLLSIGCLNFVYPNYYFVLIMSCHFCDCYLSYVSFHISIHFLVYYILFSFIFGIFVGPKLGPISGPKRALLWPISRPKSKILTQELQGPIAAHSTKARMACNQTCSLAPARLGGLFLSSPRLHG